MTFTEGQIRQFAAEALQEHADMDMVTAAEKADKTYERMYGVIDPNKPIPPYSDWQNAESGDVVRVSVLIEGGDSKFRDMLLKMVIINSDKGLMQLYLSQMSNPINIQLEDVSGDTAYYYVSSYSYRLTLMPQEALR